MMGPSDQYGDMSLEDVEEFEGLLPDDEKEIRIGGRFDRGEVRQFEPDFEYEFNAHFDDGGDKIEEFLDEDFEGELEFPEYMRETE